MSDTSENKSVYPGTEYFQHLVENLPVGVYICDIDGLITYCNKAASSIWGRMPKLNDSEDRFCRSFKLLSPDGKKVTSEESWMALAIKQNKSFNNLELIIEQPDGKKNTVLVNSDPLHDLEGNTIGVINIVIDITDRKKIENTLSKIYEVPTTLLMITDKDGTIIRVSNGWEKTLGYCAEEMQGTLFTKYIHPDDLDMTANIVTNLQRGEITTNFENRYQCKDGSYRILSWSSSVDSETGIRYGCATDITERKQTENKFRLAEDKYHAMFETSQVGMALCKMDGSLIEVNQGYLDIIGYSNEEALKLSYWDITPKEYEAQEAKQLQLMNDTGRYGPYEKEYIHKDGTHIPVLLNGSVVKGTADEKYIWSTVHNITELKRADERLSFQASHDSLTGLVNRREFERRTERLLSTVISNKEAHALCFMDLDQFKVVNDTCGHQAGDELLRQLTSVLQTVVRKRDTLARLGGDEFGVLMEHCSLDDAHRVATSLLKAVQDYQFIWEEHTFKIGVSIGLVPITEITDSLTDLLKDADAACYMAKDKGRNRIHVYHAEDTEIAERYGEMQWVERIHQAIDKDLFSLYAQSIESLDKIQTHHFELLIRMIDETGEIIPPGAFLPAAERYNLISKIDQWVITQAFSKLGDNPEFLKEFNLCSINLSGHSLTDPNILEFITSQLYSSGIDAGKICFEITETAAIYNLNNAMNLISTLKKYGCKFALDDFGSGLSSFAYLKNLPVDYLKIDGMFVKDIVDDPIDHAMVKSINEIGHVMGMQTIAEFVENDVIKGMLKEIGVNYVQGYGINKPQPFEDLLNNLNRTNS